MYKFDLQLLLLIITVQSWSIQQEVVTIMQWHWLMHAAIAVVMCDRQAWTAVVLLPLPLQRHKFACHHYDMNLTAWQYTLWLLQIVQFWCQQESVLHMTCQIDHNCTVYNLLLVKQYLVDDSVCHNLCFINCMHKYTSVEHSFIYQFNNIRYVNLVICITMNT